MERDEQVPTVIDPNTPSVARMYDYYLGGKDNFPSDREAAEKITQLVPNISQIARDNRDFLIRVVRMLAAAGVRQFIDIGTGLPTRQNVHEVALEAAPDSRIVYVDNDPIVLVHARALLAETPQTIVVGADLRDTASILDHPEVGAHIDFGRPVAVLLFAILHFVPDHQESADIVRRLCAPLAVGSHLAVSHSYAGDLTSETISTGRTVYRAATAGSLTPRTTEQISAYFDGLDVLEPGVVPIDAWRPEWPDVEPDFTKPGLLGGVARIP
ncbi:SAM-dependent methyltransferase [Nonomuraea sp. NPDC059194]|uniref:SAM-dependent methyltransferase n=1 Tax=Nonomuraea sp. NPDC059194 TaxID=3346764 RepID=UPI0036BCC399